jgi:hypothetical protein
MMFSHQDDVPHGKTAWEAHVEKIAIRAARLQEEAAERERVRWMTAAELRRHTQVQPYDPGPFVALSKVWSKLGGKIGDWFREV